MPHAVDVFPPSARDALLRMLSQPLARKLAQPWVQPRSLSDYVELLGPMWSVEKVRARVERVVRETPDVTSLWLVPNGNWMPHKAGQHVLLTVDIDGTAVTRTFTVSRAPEAGSALRLTIKAHPGGKVGAWARERARAGDVVSLSRPHGTFTLPSPSPARLLFVSGGSGVTPLLSMAQSLVANAYRGDLCWIHCDGPQVTLDDDVQAAVRDLPGARLHLHLDPQRYLTAAQITEWVPDLLQREAFVCGPIGLMSLVEGLFEGESRASQVHTEDYQARRKAAPLTGDESGRVTFARSGRVAEAQGKLSLLEEAERAGLHPAYGCRRGICHTCKCKKLSGTVRNDLTGEVHDNQDEEIRLCIHSPVGPVELDL